MTKKVQEKDLVIKEEEEEEKVKVEKEKVMTKVMAKRNAVVRKDVVAGSNVTV
jgi:hypothetical protein